MAASVQFRLQNRDLGMVMREVDEDLAIFLGMKDGEERNEHFIIENSDEFDESMRAENIQIVADGNSEYDWLTPEKIDLQDSVTTNQTDVSKDEPVSSKSEIANTCEKPATSTSSGSCNGANRKSSSSGDRKPAPRASTPTGRRPMPEKLKPSRATTPSTTAKSEPTRASSRATLTSSKPVARSSTPSKATSRPRPSTPASRTSRSATPTRKPATPLTISTALKNHIPSRGSSQSRPSKALDAQKTSMPKRPASASRGRPAAHSSSKPRQRSCSPAKVRAPNAHNVGKIVLSRSQGYGNGGSDNVNPVLMGTKMVERVVNMRKLAPPKHNELVSLDKPKKSSKDNSGFGRSLSKRSLDMAIRHMDIRRSLNIPDNLRPVLTGISSRVSNGNQSSSSQSSTVGFSESPLNSTSDSSKSSNFVDSYFLDD